MKKLLVLFGVLLMFTSCIESPADKYMDSVDQLMDAVASAGEVSNQITLIETLVSAGDLSSANISTIYASLQTIDSNLDSEILQSVISNYATSNGISLNTDVSDVKTQIFTDPGYVAYPDSGVSPSKAEVEALVDSILAKLVVAP